MCQQIVEIYPACKCVYYVHAVEPCNFFGKGDHPVKRKEIYVGFSCTTHSSTSVDAESGLGARQRLQQKPKIVDLAPTEALKDLLPATLPSHQAETLKDNERPSLLSPASIQGKGLDNDKALSGPSIVWNDTNCRIQSLEPLDDQAERRSQVQPPSSVLRLSLSQAEIPSASLDYSETTVTTASVLLPQSQVDHLVDGLSPRQNGNEFVRRLTSVVGEVVCPFHPTQDIKLCLRECGYRLEGAIERGSLRDPEIDRGRTENVPETTGSVDASILCQGARSNFATRNASETSEALTWQDRGLPVIQVTLQTPQICRKDGYGVRPCYILIILGLLSITGSLVPAIWQSKARNDLSGGFTLAQYILGVGILVIGSILAIHSRTCTCWKPQEAVIPT